METAPVFLRERLPLLDILRGFALPGILLMNIEWFTRPLLDLGRGLPTDVPAADHAAGWLIFVLVQGKFWLLFSLLFGAGFTVMRQRLLASGRPFTAPYLRRCVVLGLFGVAHGVLLWPGDILHSYALAGLLLLAVSALTERAGAQAAITLRGGIGATLFLLFVGLLGLMTLLYLASPGPAPLSPDEAAQAAAEATRASDAFNAAREQAIAAYSSGTWWEVTLQRGRDLMLALESELYVVWLALAVFLVGSWLLDSGRLSRPQDFRRFHWRMATIAFPIGLAITVLGALASTGSADGHSSNASMINQWTEQAGAPLMTLGYVGIVTLLALQPPIGAFLRRWLAPSGQMALTNYLMASAICSTLFYGYGFGWWGQVSRQGQVGLVAVVLVVQCLLSAWWLARFQYGPMEWLWRAATWLQWPPMRRR